MLDFASNAPAWVFYVGVLIFFFIVWTFRANATLLFPPRDSKSKLPLPPGNMGLPFGGQTRELQSKGYDVFIDEHLEKYGAIFKTHLFGNPYIVLSDPEHMKKVFLGENKLVNVEHTKNMHDMFGHDSMFLQRDTKHARLRQIVLKQFTPKQIGAYLPVMERIARRYIGLIDKAVQDGTTRKIGKDFHEFAFEVISTTMLGQKEGNNKVLTAAFRSINELVTAKRINFPGFQYYKSMKSRQFLENCIEKTILEAKSRKREPVDGKYRSLLEQLIDEVDEHGDELTLKSIQDNLLLMLFAGHTTSATVLSVLVSEVWRDEDLVQKLYEEQCKARPDPNAPFSMEQMQQMPLLHKTMWEGNRYIPVIPFLSRRVLKTFETGKYQVPKGYFLMLAWGNGMKMGKKFQNPRKFDPNRFGGDRNEGKESGYGFKPFGAGKRSCVGEPLAWTEMQIYLSLLIRSYKWEVVDYPVPFDLAGFPYATDGMPVRATKRQEVA